METWKLNLLPHLSATWRYRWPGLAAAWVVCVLGWLGIALIPNTYESVAQVYIDTHTLLRPLLTGLAVTTDPSQEISVVLQTLLTDPTLKRVLLATNPNDTSMSSSQMQDAVARLRKNVSLKNLPAKDLYSIGYTDHDPAYAQSVAQTLVSVLIDTNLGGQRRDADQVGNFIENQISNYQQKLEAADKRRADFKTSHLEFFAGGAGDVVGAQAAVTQAETHLKDAVDRLDSLRKQLESTPQTLNVNSPLPATMDRSGTAINLRAQLAAAIAKLTTLRAQYTDAHPNVVAQKRLLARLKSVKPEDTDGTEGISNPAHVMITSKLADAGTVAATDRNRLDEAKKRLEDAKNMAAKAIAIQREWENLDRDYQVLHINYEALVTRRESAKITQAVGDQQSSFVFRVISPPAKPDHPVAPNRLLMNAAVLAVGFGAGIGLAFGLGKFSGTFVSIGQLREAFELPVLGAVTAVPTGSGMVTAPAIFFATALSMLVLSCLIVLFFFHSDGAGVLDGLL